MVDAVQQRSSAAYPERVAGRNARGAVVTVDRCRAVCSVCGRELAGVRGLTPRKIYVSRHNRPDREPCYGYLFSNHQEVVS